MTRPRGVVLDVDGTLVDTTYLHTLAWWRAFRDAGRELPMTRFHRLIGMGGREIVEALTGGEDDRLNDGHTRRYRELRREVTRLPGARELLWELHRRGARVVLGTSAKEEDLSVLLAAIDAEGAIDAVTSSADVESGKPDPGIFLTAIARGGLDAERTVCVGDTAWDVRAAAAAGLECVCVLTGGIGREELLAAGARAVYESCATLLEELDSSPIGRLLEGAEEVARAPSS